MEKDGTSVSGHNFLFKIEKDLQKRLNENDWIVFSFNYFYQETQIKNSDKELSHILWQTLVWYTFWPSRKWNRWQ